VLGAFLTEIPKEQGPPQSNQVAISSFQLLLASHTLCCETLPLLEKYF